MCALLRRPNIVPSLFSSGEDRDERKARGALGAVGLAARVEACFLAIDGSWGQPTIGAFGRGAAVASIVLLLIGKPLMLAGLLFVGKALAH